MPSSARSARGRQPLRGSSCSSASHRLSLFFRADSASAPSVVSPIPRGGVLTMRAKRRVVTQVIGQPRVSESILDFRPRVETETAHQPVTDSPPAQASSSSRDCALVR